MRYELNDTVQGIRDQDDDRLLTVGRTIPAGDGLTVTVKDLRGQNLTIYSTETGGGTLSNPLTTDPDTGQIEGWVDPPDYDLAVVGTGVDPYTLHVRRSSVSDSRSWGVNGSNDAAALQDAIDTHDIVVLYDEPDLDASIQLRGGVTIVGESGVRRGEVDAGTRVTGPAGEPAFILPDTNNSEFEIAGVELAGLQIEGGEDGIYAPNGVIGLKLRDIKFLNPERSGIYCRGFCQEIDGQGFIEFEGGDYGLYYPDELGTGGTISRFDKCKWPTVYCHGQTKNGIYVAVEQGYNLTFADLRLVTAAEHGMRMIGAIVGCTIHNLNTEGNGYIGPGNYVAPTTGAISSGSDTLTVASAAGISIGDVLTIEGAGAAAVRGNYDHVSEVTNVAGTTITLADDALTTVSGAEVTKGQYSDVSLEFDAGVSGGSIQGMVIGNYAGGNDTLRGDNQMRYAIDAADVVDLTIGSHAQEAFPLRPIYDPLDRVRRPYGADVMRPDRGDDWQQGTLGADWTAGAGFGAKIDQRTKTVHLRGKVTADAGGAVTATVCTLPKAFRPARAIELLVPYNLAGFDQAYVTIDGNGVVTTNANVNDVVLFFEGVKYELE